MVTVRWIMKTIICKNYNEVSERAAEIIADTIKSNKNAKLGLATGSTPLGVYEILVDKYNKGELDFSSVITYNLDEYYPIEKTNDQSYHYFMNENLFSKVNIPAQNTHVPNGEAENPIEECEKYEKAIEEIGGLDLQLLGLGINGHIGFNEPDDELNAKTHVTELTESTVQANSRFFDSIDDVPKKAITVGVGTILGAKVILILVSGKAKHEALMGLLKGKVSSYLPASVLSLHKNVTVICDEEAYYGNAD
jgi:glucosamine-6-phosphate deaminase